jgi:hypothetical protein
MGVLDGYYLHCAVQDAIKVVLQKTRRFSSIYTDRQLSATFLLRLIKVLCRNN